MLSLTDIGLRTGPVLEPEDGPAIFMFPFRVIDSIHNLSKLDLPIPLSLILGDQLCQLSEEIRATTALKGLGPVLAET